MSDNSRGTAASGLDFRLVALVATGVALWLLLAAIGRLSHHFAWGQPGLERPLLTVLELFAAAYACCFLAMAVVARGPSSRGQLVVVVVFSLAFRALLLFSEPIQEVDAWRYVWDGHVALSGTSPWQFSPQQVLEATTPDSLPADLARLVALRDSSPELHTILRRVHFPQLTTVYPPVSQLVFAAAAATAPPGATAENLLLTMKVWIVAFDLGTLWLLMVILRMCAMPPAAAVAWGWCPLVLKEFANSGHLDAIAVCLTLLAVLLTLRATGNTQASPRFARWLALAATLVLALAVGAKLYPVVLAPWLVLRCGRQLGAWPALAAGSAFSLVTVTVLWPMLAASHSSRPLVPAIVHQSHARDAESAPFLPPLPEEMQPEEMLPAAISAPQPANSQPPVEQAASGLTAFVTSWRMNDFLFLLVAENLTPPATEIPQAWFVIVPAAWRTGLAEWTAQRTSLAAATVPFVLARGITLAVFVGLAVWFAWRGSISDSPLPALRFAFLTLAWFWLLLPTQNPWYWTWALPLLPFARSTAWRAVSALAMLYYLRFWFQMHGGPRVAGSPYDSELFFDYVVTWFEYGPWFVWLATEGWLRRCRQHPPQFTQPD